MLPGTSPGTTTLRVVPLTLPLPMPRHARPLLLPLALAGTLPLAGCITEVIPVRPGVVSTQGSGKNTPPIPLPARTTSTRVRFAVAPLGTIPYDGTTLPIFSPDGNALLTQVGTLAPTPIISTQPSPSPADRSLQPFAITPTGLVPIPWATTPGPRIAMGRSATAVGALVEQAEQDRTISIGRIAWSDGSISWLAERVPGPGQAIELRDGTLVRITAVGTAAQHPADISTTTPAPTSAQAPRADAQIIFEHPGRSATRIAMPGMAFAWPMTTPDQRFIAVLAWPLPTATEVQLSQAPQAEMELLIIAAPLQSARDASSATTPAPPQIVRRIPLALLGDWGTAQACVSSLAAAPPAVDGALASTITLLHPALRRVVLIDCATGRTAQLPEGTVAAASTSIARPGAQTTDGLLVARAKYLAWQQIGPFAAATGAPDRAINLRAATRAVDGAFLPRALGPGKAILLGPGPETELSLQVLALGVLPKEEEPTPIGPQ